MIVGAALFLLISLLGCAYPYFGYPLLLALRARRRSLKVRTQDIEPTVTIIIPVYNRENTIAQKLHNTLALEYPADKLEIIVVSDGSTDHTDAIVNSIQDPRIRLLSLPRSGRLVALQQGGRRAVPGSVRLGSAVDRARRGGSGALSPAIRSSGAEFPSEGSAFGVSTPVEGVDGWVPCGERSRTRSGPEGSSLKRTRSCVADQPGRSRRVAGTPEGPFSTTGARSTELGPSLRRA